MDSIGARRDPMGPGGEDSEQKVKDPRIEELCKMYPYCDPQTAAMIISAADRGILQDHIDNPREVEGVIGKPPEVVYTMTIE